MGVLDNGAGEGSALPMLVNCDWLQFWCLFSTFDPERWSRETNYKVVNTHRGTRVFKEVWRVTEKSAYTSSRRDEPFAVMACKPHSPLIDAKMVLVKIENRPLYHANLYRRIVLMLQGFGFEYKAITRIDVCCDFVRFADGSHPMELLERYHTNKWLKTGSRSYCRWNTAPYTATTAPYKLGSKLAESKHITHSASWGGAKSDCHVKMYNKTREIKVESGKQYIRRWWAQNGLQTAEDVWRVEFSVSGRSRALIDNRTGELVQVSLLEACSLKYQVATFMALADRHFSFYDAGSAVNRKHMQRVGLFTLPSDVSFSTITMPSHPNPTRTTKVCMNYLATLPEQVNLSAFCNSDLEASSAIYRCLVVLSNVYDELTIVKNGYEWKANDYAKQMLADVQLLSRMGVVRNACSAERLEDIAAILEANDKRRLLEKDLYEAYYLHIEAGSSVIPFTQRVEEEVATSEARSGSGAGAMVDDDLPFFDPRDCPF